MQEREGGSQQSATSDRRPTPPTMRICAAGPPAPLAKPRPHGLSVGSCVGARRPQPPPPPGSPPRQPATAGRWRIRPAPRSRSLPATPTRQRPPRQHRAPPAARWRRPTPPAHLVCSSGPPGLCFRCRNTGAALRQAARGPRASHDMCMAAIHPSSPVTPAGACNRGPSHTSQHHRHTGHWLREPPVQRVRPPPLCAPQMQTRNGFKRIKRHPKANKNKNRKNPHRKSMILVRCR